MAMRVAGHVIMQHQKGRAQGLPLTTDGTGTLGKQNNGKVQRESWT